MAAKRPDLDSLVVPKDGDPAAGESAGGSDGLTFKGYAHTLSLRRTAGQYRHLRR